MKKRKKEHRCCCSFFIAEITKLIVSIFLFFLCCLFLLACFALLRVRPSLQVAVEQVMTLAWRFQQVRNGAVPGYKARFFSENFKFVGFRIWVRGFYFWVWAV